MPTIQFTIDGPNVQAVVAADAILDSDDLAPLLDAISTQLAAPTELDAALSGSPSLQGVNISLSVSDARTAHASLQTASERAGFHIDGLDALTQTLRSALPTDGQQAPASSGSWVATFDGASRGNPGPAAVGATLSRNGDRVDTAHQTIGTTTNNVAEYRALETALKLAARNDVTSLTVRGDSQLIIKQVAGEWNANEKLAEYRDTIHELRDTFADVTFEHVNRSDNHHADSLANKALDTASA